MKAKMPLAWLLLGCGIGAATAADRGAVAAGPVDSLVYGYEEMFGFDVESYLAARAPHLLPHAEAISHWAGYTTISPRVLLALIEQESGLLTSTKASATAMSDPFGRLSDKSSFAEQVQDVADRLATRVYAGEAAAGIGEFSGKRDAGEPLDFLFAPADAQKAAPEAEEFALVYRQLFEREYHVPAAQDEKSDVPAKQAPNGLLQFPFPLGQSWHIGGAHTNSGSGSYPLSSLDMGRGGGWGSNQSGVWVAASAGGQFKRHSSCFAEIVHADGWSTTYYHLMNIQYGTGQSVSKNTRFANPANTYAQALCNGGGSTGPHLHWSLKRNGSWYHLNGSYLSGWRITATGNSYDTNCNRFYLTKDGWWGCSGYYSH